MHNLGQQIAQQHEQTGATMMVKALHVYMYIDTHTQIWNLQNLKVSYVRAGKISLLLLSLVGHIYLQ